MWIVVVAFFQGLGQSLGRVRTAAATGGSAPRTYVTNGAALNEVLFSSISIL